MSASVARFAFRAQICIEQPGMSLLHSLSNCRFTHCKIPAPWRTRVLQVGGPSLPQHSRNILPKKMKSTQENLNLKTLNIESIQEKIKEIELSIEYPERRKKQLLRNMYCRWLYLLLQDNTLEQTELQEQTSIIMGGLGKELFWDPSVCALFIRRQWISLSVWNLWGYIDPKGFILIW
eukprot:m.219157 g.219157  ORF g.219157 m.219157 type:complete len:178 (+) comp15913_c1_seq6:237-770(+)